MTGNANRWTSLGALVAGPLLLIVLGFVVFGAWGAVIGLFLGIAALVFIPAFAGLMRLSGARSLPGAIVIANLVPLAWWGINCPLIGNACPNYTMAAAAPWYVAATFCAVVYWAIMRRR
ncbi:MAG: hypothetical protein ABL897_07990 [Hyphomicrobium sp.]